MYVCSISGYIYEKTVKKKYSIIGGQTEYIIVFYLQKQTIYTVVNRRHRRDESCIYIKLYKITPYFW